MSGTDDFSDRRRELKPLSIPVTVFVLLLVVFPTVFAQSEIQNPTLTVWMGQAQEFRLYSNPTTGTSWWLEVAAPQLEITKLREETDTSIVCVPGLVGCGSRVAVFSVKGNVVGGYDAVFHLGHVWNHTEVYAIANLHVQVVQAVTGTTTIGSMCFPNCIYPSVPDYEHCTCVSPTATTTPIATTTTTSRTCPAQCTYGCIWGESYPEQAFCITPNPTPTNPLVDALMKIWTWLRCFFGYCS